MKNKKTNPHAISRLSGVLGCGLLLAVPVSAPAQTLESWLQSPTITKTWGGERVRLAKEGVTFTGTYVGQYGFNTGGRAQGKDYAQQIMLGTNINLQKLLGLNGAKLNLIVVSRAGRSIENDYIGSKLEPDGVYGGSENFRLMTMNYGQDYFGGKLNTLIGYYPLGTEFALSLELCSFLDNGLCAHPLSLGLDTGGGWTEPPAGAWGGRVKYFINPDLYAETGAWESNPSLQSVNNHGWQLSFKNANGAIVPVEIGLTTHFGAAHLLGHYKIGGYYDTAQVPYEENASKIATGEYGGYAVVDQMLYEFGPGRKPTLTRYGYPTRGILLFCGVMIADKRTSLISSYFDAGMEVLGPLASRPADNLSIGWTKMNINPGKITEEYNAMKDPENYTLEPAEELFEIAYNIQLTGWLTVTPDVQYDLNPGAFAYKHYPDAWIFSAQAIVDF